MPEFPFNVMLDSHVGHQVRFTWYRFAGGASANTLEEIMEQEETTAFTMSATASESQEDANSVDNMSAEVSLPPPSPDTDIPSTMSVEDTGEDQSHDLSSDGKYELCYYFSNLSHFFP